MTRPAAAQPGQTSARHILIALLVTAVLVGNNLLTSAGQGELVGSRPWAEDSILRDITELLNLNYRFATPTGTEVKDLIFGLGAAIAAIIVIIALAFRPGAEQGGGAAPDPRPGDGTVPDQVVSEESEAAPRPSLWRSLATVNLSTVRGAQMLMLIAVGWSFLSINWSHAKLFAFGGSVVMAIGLMWALGVAFGLDLRAARFVTGVLMAVSGLTAVLAIWYFYERNPVQRAKYPIGNPLFLAAVLIPALMLSVTEIVRALDRRSSLPRGKRAALLAGSALLAAAIVWVFVLTGSRLPDTWNPFALAKGFLTLGPRATIVAVAFGAVAIAFFAGGKRTKLLCTALAAALVGVTIAAMAALSDVPEYGRGATIRLRRYAWSYAFDLLKLRPWTGAGQGGYSLVADEMAGQDALLDPAPFAGRVSHAHNEWLESWTDLGTLGFVFLMGSYALTFAAGSAALSATRSRTDRWQLIGSMSALLALMVEECTNVALRLPGLPVVYFTVLGLVWARIDAADAEAAPAALPRSPLLSRPPRILLGGLGVAVALGVLLASILDWQGALAQTRAPSLARGFQFDAAVRAADRARRWRLNPVRRLEAANTLLAVDVAAATHHLLQAQERSQRARQEGTVARLAALIEEDINKARRYAQDGLAGAFWLRDKGAKSAFLAGWFEARLCALLASIEEGANHAEESERLRLRAAEALKIENRRHRLDEDVVLELLRLAHEMPTAQRITLLLGPLRAGPASADLTAEAQRLFARQDFEAVFAQARDEALDDMRKENAKDWSSELAPEIVRFAALRAAADGDLRQAADVAERAAEGYRHAGSRLQVGLVAALVEKARYLLFSDPADPAPAAAVAKQASQAVPSVADATAIETPILVEMAHQHLARLEEEPAGKLIERLNPGLDPEALPELIARAYVGLAHRLLSARPDPPLELVDRWLVRAIELAPEDPEPVLTRARVLFMLQRDDEVVQQLARLEELIDEPSVIDRFIERVLQMRPSAPLAELRDRRRPPTTAPATAPAAAPGQQP